MILFWMKQLVNQAQIYILKTPNPLDVSLEQFIICSQFGSSVNVNLYKTTLFQNAFQTDILFSPRE